MAKATGLLGYQEFHKALQNFAEQIKAKFAVFAKGEPEDQLKPPTDALFSQFSKIILRKLVLKGEAALDSRLGKPDFALNDKNLPIGYIELKAPGKGANPANYKGHDKKQWDRFKHVPNILYTDGNEWAVYRNGELIPKHIRFDGDICRDGKKAVSESASEDLFHLLIDFIKWTPILPKKPRQLAAFLAPFCLLIREEVLDALKDENSPTQSLKREIKDLLFPDADDFKFADAYAQTIIFALLLAQMEGADVLELQDAYNTLASHHLLLSRSLQFLTDPQAITEISSSVALTQRVIHEIPKEILETDSETEDPWLFFYEDFLAAYDPKLRKESGVYYTPIEIVRCQVRLIDEILRSHLGKEMGFVENGVATLDPALGTGTYLLGIINHSLGRVVDEEGSGAVKSAAKALMTNLHGFEFMVGPYAVAQLRFTRALTSHKIAIPKTGPGIYLTNTLESPHTKPPAPPLFHQPIAHEHKRALEIKDNETVLVCLGNPPYGRHEASTKENRSTTGGWVRYGDYDEHESKGKEIKTPPILEAFLEPASKAGFGVHLKNLYNLYVYFIRWSLWKVFEHKTAKGPGILSFITASSYLDGDAFVGIREHMRRICDHIDIIDLGGEGHGARIDENVFAIQTPVAIFVGYRKAKSGPDTPAVVRYTRIEGTREEKLSQLNKVQSAQNLQWKTISNGWQDSFRPQLKTTFAAWPSITDILPWQNNGVQCKRTWVIGHSIELLEQRWLSLLSSDNKREAMKESGDRTIDLEQQDLFDSSKKLPAISTLSKDAKPQKIVKYSYRSFDRQYLLADNRLISRPRPPLWQTHSDKQIYLTSLLTKPLGIGPALTACAEIPDLDHFSNRGAKDVLPLYRNANATEVNILPGLLELLAQTYGTCVQSVNESPERAKFDSPGRSPGYKSTPTTQALKGRDTADRCDLVESMPYCKTISPEDFAGYVYALLAHPEYTRRFEKELGNRNIHVPLTKNGKLFFEAAEFGKSLIWLQTYARRMTDKNHPQGQIPKGRAKSKKAISEDENRYPEDYSYDESSQTLIVGDGSFAPVSKEVYEFEVSGLKVVQSWLGYRMKKRAGKTSSPLDAIRPKHWTHQFTRELLELLWVLEKTVEGYPQQIALFEKILESELFLAKDLPDVPPEMRDAPKPEKKSPQMDIKFED